MPDKGKEHAPAYSRIYIPGKKTKINMWKIKHLFKTFLH